MTQTATILVIDDEPQIRKFLRISLATQGYKVLEAGTGSEGLAQAALNKPDLLVLDLGLPGMDGREVRRRQLLWPQMARIPVIVLSGHPELEAATRTMEARAVLAKPVQLSHLVRAVDEYCSDADPEAGALRLRLMRTHAWSSASVRRR